MKYISILLSAIGLLTALISCTPSNQGSVYQGVSTYYNETILNERIEKQQKHINQGITSGELTTKETKVVQDNLNWIQKRYERMTADGVLTEKELDRLDKMLDKNDKMITDNKTNPAKKLYESDIQERMESQQNEIHQGFTSGKLTKKEADKVQDNLNEIRKKYAKMSQDGTVTEKELEKIDTLLNKNSKLIYQKEKN